MNAIYYTMLIAILLAFFAGVFTVLLYQQIFEK